jgi:hypothetical protein
MGVKTIARAVLTEKLVIPFMIRFLRFEKRRSEVASSDSFST